MQTICTAIIKKSTQKPKAILTRVTSIHMNTTYRYNTKYTLIEHNDILTT